MKQVVLVFAGFLGAVRGALLQAQSNAAARDTPVTRVVSLLQEISRTLQKDMEEDEALFKKLSCWCNDGRYEKQEAIKASSSKIAELHTTIDGSDARAKELYTAIQELEAQLAADKQALAEATALREKQLAEFHGKETGDVQALENLKAAIAVLKKHQNAPPESTVAGGAVFKSERAAWSLLEIGERRFPWSDAHEPRSSRALDDFMLRAGLGDDAPIVTPTAPRGFLQAHGAAGSSAWTSEEQAVVASALKSAASLAQSRHGASYVPAYQAASGEIFGVLKQLEEELGGDLKEAQDIERERVAAFEQLRSAKAAQIKSAEALAERKEDELANVDNSLAEAKEDLQKQEEVLAADQEFLGNLNGLCSKGSKDFDARKAMRLEEMKAVAETIQILQEDKARDAMGAALGFVQLAASAGDERRTRASALLRQVSRKTGNSELTFLATSVELDAFLKVKQAIDEMLKTLQTQQEDEVKKNGWCKDELHENEMSTAEEEDSRAGLEARLGELEQATKTLGEEIAAANAEVAQTQLDLQRATEDRQKENREFQKTIADQTLTIEVLKKALERLAKFYDSPQEPAKAAALLEQTPPVPQKEYKPNSGATGVMEMIEKLVFDAKDLMKESRSSESAAQAGYEQLIADTNRAVAALQRKAAEKAKMQAEATKDKLATESSLADSVRELDGFAKYDVALHKECDYLLRNFDLRQQKRTEEMEGLRQAKQILSGASFE